MEQYRCLVVFSFALRPGSYWLRVGCALQFSTSICCCDVVA